MPRALVAQLGITPLLAALLCRRGITYEQDARLFLYPRLKFLGDPFKLTGMNAAVERILAALDRQERIVLYGDYDVDGITSLALLTRVLCAFGTRPECFLPLRMDEGYGLSAEGVRRCVETYQPQLLIAVDCGTSSVTEVAGLQGSGIDVVIFDHHECKLSLPPCVALVNPKASRDETGETSEGCRYLCSVGLVFKLCHALLKRRPQPGFDLRRYLDLVALGTVADLVPLVHENRILVQKGLRELEKTTSVGLRALMDIAGVRPPAGPGDIGFKLGPRLNAAGRLGTAQEALELLLTDDATRARTLASQLDVQNRERQNVEKTVLAEAEGELAKCFDRQRDAAIIVGAEGWHPGVLGIVASRLAKAHHRPTFVIGFDESGIGKGSGRSIEGLSLVRVLEECSELLEKFGGHEMAAGVTVHREQFAAFRKRFGDCARALLHPDDLEPCLHLDVEVALGELNYDFLTNHELLQPFGMGNAPPLFFARGVAPAAEPRIVGEKHLQLSLRQNGCARPAVLFNTSPDQLPRPPWDVAFRIERNEYRDTVSVQMQVQCVRPALP